jgi:DNA polymerase
MHLELTLDARQKAMLREMGIKVWQSTARPEPAVLAESANTAELLPPPDQQNVRPTIAVNQSQNLPNIVHQVATPIQPVSELASQLTSAQLDALSWSDLIQKASQCDACRLASNRQKMVWGRFLRPSHQEQNTAIKTSVLVVLDPPSEYEEDAASPAVMQVGKLVHAMLKAAGLDSDEQVVFLSNVSKCRIPTGLRSPQADITTCLAYLDQQIKRLQPKTLLVLGWGAAQVLSPKMEPRPSGNALGHLRGVVQHYLGIPTIVSFAPAYLIRNPQDKAKTWDDLCLLMQCLEGE